MSSADIPSIATQKAAIDASLNSTLMALFLIGIYMGIYIKTVQIYLSGRQTSAALHRHIIVGTLTALFLTILAQMVVQWYFTSIIFSTLGVSRLAIFIDQVEITPVPPPVAVTGNILQDIGFLLADGLMVWRCFHACGRSLLRFGLPMAFFLAELALIIADMAFVSLFYLHPDFYTAERARQADRIAGAAQVSVVVTSLTASFTICYHIYTSTSRNTRSRRRYMHIVELLVQSSFAYTVMQTVLIVDYFMGTGTLGDNKIILFILGDYFNALANIASGLVPTLMVARITFSSSRAGNTRDSESSVELPSELIQTQSGDNNFVDENLLEETSTLEWQVENTASSSR